MSKEIHLAKNSELNKILAYLRRNPVRNGAVIQDLLVWSEQSKFYFIESDDEISFLHLSGHPAHHNCLTLMADGEPYHIATLLNYLSPDSPFVVRETSSHLASVVKTYFSEAIIYPELRMDVDRDKFRPSHKGIARPLSESDATALAKFHGAPPQAAPSFVGWLKGARAVYGVFDKDRLVAIGSSKTNLPEVWDLVSIETLPDYRGRGYATEVTSILVDRALTETETVCVTVVSDNKPAIHVYEKLGFRKKQERMWADCGAGAAP